jgi:hypothetical protein
LSFPHPRLPAADECCFWGAGAVLQLFATLDGKTHVESSQNRAAMGND